LGRGYFLSAATPLEVTFGKDELKRGDDSNQLSPPYFGISSFPKNQNAKPFCTESLVVAPTLVGAVGGQRLRDGLPQRRSEMRQAADIGPMVHGRFSSFHPSPPECVAFPQTPSQHYARWGYKGANFERIRSKPYFQCLRYRHV